MKSARSEKSLSLLCQKFLSYYPHSVNSDQKIIIHLDNMAEILEVERRRIYDIVNVLESVEILTRFCKNQYIWHGYDQIGFTLAKLKTLSVKSNFLNYTKTLMASQLESTASNLDMTPCSSSSSLAFENDFDHVGFELHKSSSSSSSSTSSSSFSMCSSSSFERILTNGTTKVEMKDASTQTINVSREEKSLGIMSQKFLMLFLTSQDGLVSINFAARVLLGDTKNDTTELGRFKTKIRRLYDIASVLTSIGLIKKYHFTDVNISKPAYMYVGPNVDIIREAENVVDFQNSGNPQSNSKHSLFDHFKRKLDMECNIPTFDINTGILASKKVKTMPLPPPPPPQRQSSITSLNKQSIDEEARMVKTQNENPSINLGIVKQEQIEIEHNAPQENTTFQSTNVCDNNHYYHEQYLQQQQQQQQQYYNYSHADQAYDSNLVYNNSNANIYQNENSFYTSNSQLYYQRYYHQHPPFNVQLQSVYYNAAMANDEQQKITYNCGQKRDQETTRAPHLIIDESTPAWAYSREEVNVTEQVEKFLTSASTATSSESSEENVLPSFSTFLN